MYKFYYAGHSSMGVNFTYDSPCWILHVFDNKNNRDKWVKENEYNNENVVAEVVNAKDAENIISRRGMKDLHYGMFSWDYLERTYRLIFHGFRG